MDADATNCGTFNGRRICADGGDTNTVPAILPDNNNTDDDNSNNSNSSNNNSNNTNNNNNTVSSTTNTTTITNSTSNTITNNTGSNNSATTNNTGRGQGQGGGEGEGQGEGEGEERSASGGGCDETLSCQGDPIACLALQQQKQQACLAESQQDFMEQFYGDEANQAYDVEDGLSGWMGEMAEEYGGFADLEEGGALDHLVDLTDLISMDKTIPATCMADYTFSWRNHTYTVPFSRWCPLFQFIGSLVIITTALISFKVIIGAF